MQRLRRYLWVGIALMLLSVASSGTVTAIKSQSPNFEISEPEFGSGAALESCSGEFCAKATIGETTPGKTARSSKTAAFSNLSTDSEPSLEVIIEPGESNLGVLGTERTATSQSIIKVRSYLSDGYTLVFMGDPPRYHNHTLDAPDTPTLSMPGTEQFGVNLVANTTPAIGADPVQEPSEDFSYGEVEPDYAIANRYLYRSGDTVARSLSESGQTTYTVSIIINVANSTPAGHFTSDFSAVVIPVF